MPSYRINGKNVLFIHVPKTGGTSIGRFLARHSPVNLHSQGGKFVRPVSGAFLTKSLPFQHFHAELLEAMFAPGYFDYAFMIVRDPVERMKSEYRHTRAAKNLDSSLSFNAWTTILLSLTKAAPNLRNNHFRPQISFECFGAEVFRFEDGMPKIVAALADRLDIPRPATIPHERYADGPAIGVSPATADFIRRAYADDYARYGY